MILTWEIAGTAFGIIMGLGGLAVRWIVGEISEETALREKGVAALEKKIDDETHAFEQKLDHKHRNVQTAFQAVDRKLDQNCDKLDAASKDIVRLNEAQKTQEQSIREIKVEMKEAIHDLRQSLAAQIDNVLVTQKTQFDALTQSIREIRNVAPRP